MTIVSFNIALFLDFYAISLENWIDSPYIYRIKKAASIFSFIHIINESPARFSSLVDKIWGGSHQTKLNIGSKTNDAWFILL